MTNAGTRALPLFVDWLYLDGAIQLPGWLLSLLLMWFSPFVLNWSKNGSSFAHMPPKLTPISTMKPREDGVPMLWLVRSGRPAWSADDGDVTPVESLVGYFDALGGLSIDVEVGVGAFRLNADSIDDH